MEKFNHKALADACSEAADAFRSLNEVLRKMPYPVHIKGTNQIVYITRK